MQESHQPPGQGWQALGPGPQSEPMANTMLEQLCRLVLLSVLLVAGVVGATQDANANGGSRELSGNVNAAKPQR